MRMKLLFFVLNETEKLDDVLTELATNGIKGATVIDSMGMARILSNNHDDNEISFLSSLRSFLNPEREKNNLIFTVINDTQLEIAVKAIESVTGDLSQKNTGVIFSVPVDFTKGIG
jgi:nitrogen regulatory protein PII